MSLQYKTDTQESVACLAVWVSYNYKHMYSLSYGGIDQHFYPFSKTPQDTKINLQAQILG